MFRFLSPLFPVLIVFSFGCEPKSKPPVPTVFESKHEKHEHDHPHERGKMMLADFGPHHAGLTAHLSKKEGNELDVVFETADKEPKPLPLPLTKLTAKATRTGDDKEYALEFEPAEKDERKDDPEGKCSRFTAKAPWIKHEDKLTVVLTVTLDGQVKKPIWTDFNPKQFAHVDE
jgi:hypothetical protein